MKEFFVGGGGLPSYSINKCALIFWKVIFVKLYKAHHPITLFPIIQSALGNFGGYTALDVPLLASGNFGRLTKFKDSKKNVNQANEVSFSQEAKLQNFSNTMQKLQFDIVRHLEPAPAPVEWLRLHSTNVSY